MVLSMGCVAQVPVINELLPSGPGEDRVELFNPTDRSVDMMGWSFVVNGRVHRFGIPLVIAPNALVVLGSRGSDAAGLSFSLPRSGGSLLLIGPDRRTVHEVVSWPALRKGLAMGRLEDGGQKWGYSLDPTIGRSNATGTYADRLLAPPVLLHTDDGIEARAEQGAVIRYTLDGHVPDSTSPMFTTALRSTEGAIVTACAFAPKAVPSLPSAITCVEQEGSYLALGAAPEDLFDEVTGLLSSSPYANFARKGKAWQRPVRVQFVQPSGEWSGTALIAVSGSGTRGLPKKNLKLIADEEEFAIMEDAPGEVMLRADGSPHAWLRNLFMETIAASGSCVDVQPSRPLPLYLNGDFQGAYRLMPAKNSAWLRALSGAEAVDLIDGPSARVLSGEGARYRQWLVAMEQRRPLDSLATLMEVRSLIDLACFDLWTGRADHDLNTRCWRPAERGGRLRWILFDMDLWSPVEEGTVERMCSESAPVAPFLPELLAHPQLRDELLARMSAWLASALSPAFAAACVDSLVTTHGRLMEADYVRWQNVWERPTPEESREAILHHIHHRPQPLMRQLAEQTGKRIQTVSVRIRPAGAGVVLAEDLPLHTDAIAAFAGVPMDLRAQVLPGFAFVGWDGVDEAGETLTIDPAHVRSVTALFRPVSEDQP